MPCGGTSCPKTGRPPGAWATLSARFSEKAGKNLPAFFSARRAASDSPACRRLALRRRGCVVERAHDVERGAQLALLGARFRLHRSQHIDLALQALPLVRKRFGNQLGHEPSAVSSSEATMRLLMADQSCAGAESSPRVRRGGSGPSRVRTRQSGAFCSARMRSRSWLA